MVFIIRRYLSFTLKQTLKETCGPYRAASRYYPEAIADLLQGLKLPKGKALTEIQTEMKGVREARPFYVVKE
jgi:hypothetical protein